jgi:hypothetical protein
MRIFFSCTETIANTIATVTEIWTIFQKSTNANTELAQQPTTFEGYFQTKLAFSEIGLSEMLKLYTANPMQTSIIQGF